MTATPITTKEATAARADAALGAVAAAALLGDVAQGQVIGIREADGVKERAEGTGLDLLISRITEY